MTLPFASLDDDKLKKSRSFLPSQHFTPRKIIILTASITLSLFFYFIFPKSDKSLHKPLRTGKAADNWGDYIGLGLAREKVLESTPSYYGELGDNWNDGISGTLYRTLLDTAPGENGQVVAGGGGFDKDSRRGVLGGSSVEWSSGVVGMGTYLGSVDMRIRSKDSTLNSNSKKDLILQDYIMKNAWLYQDEKDRIQTEKLLAEANEMNYWNDLPLRDQVRGKPEEMKVAAESWSRIYGSMQGEFTKSALEIGIEKLVRRVPVVIFSKTGCPHSKRAKDFFTRLRIAPLLHIIEIDDRPDVKSLRALLKRKTNFSTFPNIIIGGRSIGGMSDLELLEKSGELDIILKELGVEARLS